VAFYYFLLELYLKSSSLLSEDWGVPYKTDIFVTEKDKRINELENKIASDSFNNKQIFNEAKAIFPVIKALSVSKHTFYFAKDSMVINTVLLYKADKKLVNTDQQKFTNWLKQKLPKDSIMVIYKN